MITLTAAEIALFADEPPDRHADFRRLLRASRHVRGWSMERLATEAGIDHSLISRIESGARNPTRDTIARLARALDLDDDSAAEFSLAAGFVPDGIDRDTLRRALDLARDMGGTR